MIRTIGIDETGRGACFGPLVACAAAFPEDGLDPALLARLGDSKTLSPKTRMELVSRMRPCVSFAFGAATSAEVDALNPLRATMLAMRRAYSRLVVRNAWDGEDTECVVDGPCFPEGCGRGKALVRGDSLVPEIMAASILAKEFRDALIARLAAKNPGYGLERHAGYGTAAHFEAIRRMGETRWHRTTFLVKMKAAASTTLARRSPGS